MLFDLFDEAQFHEFQIDILPVRERRSSKCGVLLKRETVR